MVCALSAQGDFIRKFLKTLRGLSRNGFSPEHYVGIKDNHMNL